MDICIGCATTKKTRLADKIRFRTLDREHTLQFINWLRAQVRESPNPDGRKNLANLVELQERPANRAARVCQTCNDRLDVYLETIVPMQVHVEPEPQPEPRPEDENMEVGHENHILADDNQDSDGEEDIEPVDDYFGSELGSDDEGDANDGQMGETGQSDTRDNSGPNDNRFRKGAHSHASCTFGCGTSNQLVQVPNIFRRILVVDYRFYVVEGSRMCVAHDGTENWWPLVNRVYRWVSTAEELIDIIKLQKEYIDYLRNGSSKLFFDCQDFESIKPKVFETWFGYTKEQFEDIQAESRCTRRQLAIFLCKMRNNLPNENIGTFFGVGRTTVGKEISEAVKQMTQHLVPLYLDQTREQLLQHRIPTAQVLFNIQPDQLCCAMDGTYRHIEKSTNMLMQKVSYSVQKGDNIYKIMCITMMDGFIARLFVDFEGKKSDGPITIECFQKYQREMGFLQQDDTMIADRGFRRVADAFTDRGINFAIPLSKNPGESQLNVDDGNATRDVTHVRFIVEQDFGRLQSKFKFLAGTVRNVNLKWDSKAYKICAALLNKFHVSMIPDTRFEGIVQRMIERRDKRNLLLDLIKDVSPKLTIAKRPFEPIDHHYIGETIPPMSEDDLFWISLGSYQIDTARGYYGFCRDEDGRVNMEMYGGPHARPLNYRDYDINIESANAILVRGIIKSRFVNGKTRKAFVLFDKSEVGERSVREYWCDCPCGARTVGCCSHVMFVIWWLGWAHDKGVVPPRDGFPQRQYGDQVGI